MILGTWSQDILFIAFVSDWSYCPDGCEIGCGWTAGGFGQAGTFAAIDYLDEIDTND